MEETEKREAVKWTQMMENMDVLFARVAGIEKTQQQMLANLELQSKVIQQIDATGAAVACLTLNKKIPEEPLDSPLLSEDADGVEDQGPRFFKSDPQPSRLTQFHNQRGMDHSHISRCSLSKMSFPKFDGVDP